MLDCYTTFYLRVLSCFSDSIIKLSVSTVLRAIIIFSEMGEQNHRNVNEKIANKGHQFWCLQTEAPIA